MPRFALSLCCCADTPVEPTCPPHPFANGPVITSLDERFDQPGPLGAETYYPTTIAYEPWQAIAGVTEAIYAVDKMTLKADPGVGFGLLGVTQARCQFYPVFQGLCCFSYKFGIPSLPIVPNPSATRFARYQLTLNEELGGDALRIQYRIDINQITVFEFFTGGTTVERNVNHVLSAGDSFELKVNMTGSFPFITDWQFLINQTLVASETRQNFLAICCSGITTDCDMIIDNIQPGDEIYMGRNEAGYQTSCPVGFSISYDDYDTPGATPNPAFNWNLLGFYAPGTETQSVIRTGGADPVTYILSAGSLPQGWQLDANTGELSKTSTLTPVASGSFTIEATDSTAATATATVTWDVQ